VLIPAQLSSDEENLLKDWYRNGVSPLTRDRAHAVLLGNQGKFTPEIARILYRKEETIRGWLSGFKKSRLSSLPSKYKGNTNASKLTLSQKEQIKQVLSSPPSDYGIPKEFWQVRDLKKWVKTEFGIVYESDRSYHFLFKLGRFSWKLPDKFDSRRDDLLVKERIRAIREEIKPYLESSEWEVLTADETRLVWESESRRAWLKTNEKTILRVSRSKDYQSFLGSLNLKTGKCHLHSLSWQNQEEVIKALVKLKKKYPNKRICYIWDNAKWHKGKVIREELKKGNLLYNFHLISLPPYAPDTNPVEHIWKYAKGQVAHKPSASFKEKVNNFKLSVIHRKFDYRL
jgi:transposase